MIKPVILEGSGNATLSLYGAHVSDEIIWADAYDGTRAFEAEEVLTWNEKKYKTITPIKQYFQCEAVYKAQGRNDSAGEIILERVYDQSPSIATDSSSP